MYWSGDLGYIQINVSGIYCCFQIQTHWNNSFLAEIARFTSKILSCWKEKAKDVTKRNSNLAQVCLNFQKKFTNYTSKYSWWGQAGQFQFLDRELQIRVYICRERYDGFFLTNIKSLANYTSTQESIYLTPSDKTNPDLVPGWFCWQQKKRVHFSEEHKHRCIVWYLMNEYMFKKVVSM